MRFAAYSNALPPNIVVDGSANQSTVLTLSHWPKSGTPAALKSDTSAEIVFRYLESDSFHVDEDIVTNNHFDQDGLVGVFTLTHPEMARRHRKLLIDVATAGDFGVYQSREAARITFAIASLSEAESSTFPRETFSFPYPRMAAELYVRTLEVMSRLLTNLDDFRSLWEAEDTKLGESEQLVAKGTVQIEETPDLDFAVVRIPEHVTSSTVHRFTSPRKAECHPFAIHNATPCTRLLLIQGQHVEFQYRYEGWVQFQSRRPQSRVDLAPLSKKLNELETSGGQWTFDGVDEITPRLYLEGASNSSIPAKEISSKLQHELRTVRSTWNPYD